MKIKHGGNAIYVLGKSERNLLAKTGYKKRKLVAVKKSIYCDL